MLSSQEGREGGRKEGPDTGLERKMRAIEEVIGKFIGNQGYKWKHTS